MPEPTDDIRASRPPRSRPCRADRATPMSAPQPSAIEERRRLRRERQRRFVIWVSVASIVTLVAAIGTVGTLIVTSLASADEPAAQTQPDAEPTPEPIEFADDVPARRERRRAVHDRDGHVVVRERRDGREPRRRLQRAAARHRRHVRGRLAGARQVRRRGRGGRRRLPEPRARGAADRLAARLLHLARAGSRRRRDLGARRRHQRRIVQHRARDARSPRRVDRLGHEAADLGRRVRLGLRRGAVERPRPPRVGRLQARQDEPPGRDIR